ncbi:MAG: hypothetical protein ACYTEW_11225 [Planctomycetota bacterium]|jgi:uncharacterized repeat protein (TIGR04076 family)
MTNKSADKIEKRWKKFQKMLDYTDEELAIYRSFPKNVKAVEEAPAFVKHYIVIEVLEAHNCAAGYQVGDKFFVDGDGCLIVDKCPPKLCTAAVWAFKPLVDRIWEAFYNGGTDILHDTVRCPDVGVHKGGAGEVTLRVRAVPKDPEKRKKG